jgi:hypothetical protein
VGEGTSGYVEHVARRGDDVYVVGGPPSDPPTATAIDGDGSVLAFGPAGELLLSTRTPFTFGGLAIDADGAIYLLHTTETAFEYPTTPGSIQPAIAGASDLYLMKIAPDASAMEWATFLGGSGYDSGLAIDLAPDGSVFVTGETLSDDFPVATPIQSQLKGTRDSFVTGVTSDGSTLAYSTYWGGTGWDQGVEIEVGATGTIDVWGETSSFDFPVRHPLQTDRAAGGDLSWVRLRPDGSQPIVSTYLGGEEIDWRPKAGTGTDGYPVVLMGTSSTNLPVSHPFPSLPEGPLGGFLARIGPVGAPLRTVSVERFGTGAGGVTSSPVGIACGTDCRQSFQDGTVVNLYAVPAVGSKFTGWAAPCLGRRPCTIVAWRAQEVRARFDEAIPPTWPVVTLHPARTFQVRDRIRVSWHATDIGTGIASYDVFIGDRLRRGFWKQHTTRDSAPFVNDAPWTYCFAARAWDRVDNRSERGDFRCTTFPFDDRHSALDFDARWRRINAPEHYHGTFTRTSAEGASMVSSFVFAHRIALIADTGPSSGRVDVLWRRDGGSFRKLRNVDLRSALARTRRVFLVADFDQLRGGYVKLVAVGDGVVRIDGVAAESTIQAEMNRT